MNLDHLADLGDFIGGVAVLVTLIYLAVQVRQGTAALGANWHHQMLDSAMRNVLTPLFESRELSEFLRFAQHHPDELDEVDWDRFVRHAYGAFGLLEDAFVSYQKSLIDERYWKSWDGACRSMYTAPGYRKFWELEREGHALAFRNYVESSVFPKA